MTTGPETQATGPSTVLFIPKRGNASEVLEAGPYGEQPATMCWNPYDTRWQFRGSPEWFRALVLLSCGQPVFSSMDRLRRAKNVTPGLRYVTADVLDESRMRSTTQLGRVAHLDANGQEMSNG